MFKQGIQGILNKSRSIMTKSFGTETQRILASMIYDDEVEVLTTFDMNRIATLTFGDEVCGEIFDVLEYTLRHPIEFTVLTLHKTLVLLRHLAIYASQKAANATWILKPHIEPLTKYNTVLLALDNPKSILGRVQRIKGGNVDRGRPVRDSAKAIFDLVNNVEMFKTVRSQSEDPDSLVPVGNKEEVGFVSDDVRKAMLEEKVRKERDIKIKSNLKTPDEAIFGGGYVSKDGKTVVGAAHGLEEMLKMAEKKNGKKYSDTGQVSQEDIRHKEHLERLKYEFQMNRVNSVSSPDSQNSQNSQNNQNGSNYVNSGSGHGRGRGSESPVIVDLLDFGNDEPDPTPQPRSEPHEPEMRMSPSLPYPSSKEETYFVPENENEDEHEIHASLPVPVAFTNATNKGGIFDTALPPKIETTPSGNDDLLGLTEAPPSTSTNAMNGLQNTISAMGNMNLNPMTTTPSKPSVFDNSANSLLDPISSSMTQNENNVMGGGLGTGLTPGMMGNSSNSNSASAISSLDIPAPMPMGGTSQPPMNERPCRPPTPVDSPPAIPPLPSSSPPALPPSELRSSPIPMGGMAQPPPAPIPMGGMTQSQSSPIPMGGMAASQSPSSMTPNNSNDVQSNNGMSSPAMNAGNGNQNGNSMNQQEMMMMMMNQQQQMMQGMNGGGNGNNQQVQMMQQMMMMNQQMMQQMMAMNQGGQQQALSPQQQMMQQQQQMMMMGQQQDRKSVV